MSLFRAESRDLAMEWNNGKTNDNDKNTKDNDKSNGNVNI
jgi:hypothetical protein